MARLIELVLNGRKRVDAVPGQHAAARLSARSGGPTGTKTGCDGGECGACTVLVDDQPRLSCLTLAASVDGTRDRHRRIARPTTASLRRSSAASMKSSAPSAAIARRASIMASAGPAAPAIRRPSDDEIREALGSNICRCTGYVKIIEAVQFAAELLSRGRRAMNETVQPHQVIGAYHAAGRRAGEGLRARPNTPPTSRPRTRSPAASIAAPTRMPRFSRSMCPRR